MTLNVQAVRLLDVGAEHAEGVTWDAGSQALLFVDIPAGHVYRHDAAGKVTYTDVGRPVGAVHPRAAGGLILAVREGIAVLEDGRLRTLAAPYASDPQIRMNDAGVDPAGRYFAGSMAFDFTEGAGSLFCLDLDRSLRTVLEATTISNGIDWSPDATRCYFIDSPLRRVDVFDYDIGTGRLANRRPLVHTPPHLGLPDGLTVDEDGGIWVALFGGGQVHRYTPDGALSAVVEVGDASLVTSCCFGGQDLTDLYISTSTENLSPEQLAEQPGAGCIFVARPGWRGKPTTPFAG